MASERQIAANRANALKSTGPRTEEGKAKARMNALKHGMTAQTVVLPHEEQTSYEEIRQQLINSYNPVNEQETMLVDDIARARWRMLRSARTETALLDLQMRTAKRKYADDQQTVNEDESLAVVLAIESDKAFANWHRYNASAERLYFRAITALERAQAARRRAEDQERRAAIEIHKEAKRMEKLAIRGEDGFLSPEQIEERRDSDRAFNTWISAMILKPYGADPWEEYSKCLDKIEQDKAARAAQHR